MSIHRSYALWPSKSARPLSRPVVSLNAERALALLFLIPIAVSAGLLLALVIVGAIG